MGLFGLGKLIQFVPHPVTTGFTAGIAVVIAILQLGDLLGIGRLEGERIAERLAYLTEHLAGFQWADLAVGLLTLAVLIFWPRISKRVPSPLVGLVVATVAGILLTRSGSPVATIQTEFGGVPAGFPTPALPWAGSGLGWSDVYSLVPTAAAIAMLGAIESLLCAVVADGMTGGRHDPDSELVGLGLGNLVVPFFGGFAATGAIARTATAIRAGGRTPITVVVHALFLLASMLALARLLSYIPMAGMAALLLIVAWNMADRHHFVRITRIAPRSDVLVMWTCFLLTVIFDMVASSERRPYRQDAG